MAFDELSQEMINFAIEGYENSLKGCIEFDGKWSINYGN